MRSWVPSESAGSSVVQITATRFAARMSWTRRPESFALASRQIASADAGLIVASIPKYRFSSRWDQ